MWGQPGGAGEALLESVLSVGAPPAGQDNNDERRCVVDVFLFERIGGTLPVAPLLCESCNSGRVAAFVVIVPGALRVDPFLVCVGCRP